MMAEEVKDPVNKSQGKAKSSTKAKLVTNSTSLPFLTKLCMTNCKEVPSYKLISSAVVSERLNIHGSVARATFQELLNKGCVKH
jgi:ribosomal protein S25